MKKPRVGSGAVGEGVSFAPGTRPGGPYVRWIVLGVAIVGCTPGYSLETISQTSSSIVIEYTHSVGGEFQAAVQSAQSRCRQYGKNARLNGQPIRLGVDRSVATFDCVAP
jgi:hypothetical protein